MSVQGAIALLLFGSMFLATTLPSSAHTTQAKHTSMPDSCPWQTVRIDDVYTPHYHDHIQLQAQYSGSTFCNRIIGNSYLDTPSWEESACNGNYCDLETVVWGGGFVVEDANCYINKFCEVNGSTTKFLAGGSGQSQPASCGKNYFAESFYTNPNGGGYAVSGNTSNWSC